MGIICLVGSVCEGSAQPVSSVFFEKLTQQIQKNAFLRQNPGMNRLRWMRFYTPTPKVVQRSGFWERVFQSLSETEKQRAVASYLYQMYISSASYEGEIPPRLTVNYLGVLNSMERLEVNFDAQKALPYYKKYKKEIKQWLVQFFKEANLPTYQPKDPKNDIREISFLKTLAGSVEEDGRAGYLLAAPRWNTALPQQDAIWLEKVQQLASADIKGKVILYEETLANFSPLDKISGQYVNHGKQYLFRQAAQECAACSYLTCTQLCKQMQSASFSKEEGMQLYQLQMRPLSGKVLIPAVGNKFQSPQGKSYPNWFYHEAVLVIINHDKQYIPVVLDPFLASEPIAFSDWLKQFKMDESILYAYPFIRWNDLEERIVQPDQVQKNQVLKNGCWYHPYPTND